MNIRPTSFPNRFRQRGVYAVEYALVFLLFFSLIYACICYAVLFTFRFAIQTAAEEGARAGLKVQAVADPIEQARNRERIAGNVAEIMLAKALPQALLPPQIEACIRKGDDEDCAVVETTDCKNAAVVCQITVNIKVSGLQSMLPALVPIPDTLTGQASLMLDRRTF